MAKQLASRLLQLQQDAIALLNPVFETILFPILGLSLVLGAQFAGPHFVVAAELSEIQARGYLIVAVKENWRPLGFHSDTGELVGLEIDLARQLATELFGDPDAVRLQPVANRDRIEAVLSGEVDLAIAGITATDSRRRLVNFSIPYYLDGVAFVTRNPNIQRLADVARYPIAMLNGSSAVPVVRSNLPRAELVQVSSYIEALQFLNANPDAVFAGDAAVLAGWVQTEPDYRLVPTLLSGAPLAIAMPKGLQHDELHRRVNAIVRQWHETGWLEERLNTWGLP